MHSLSSVAQPADPVPLYALERYSFSDGAARLISDRMPHVSVQNLDTIEEVFDVMQQPGTTGLVPIENSTHGPVLQHIDLLSDGSMEVIGSVRYKVQMCMGGKPGGKGAPVRAFYSHTAGLGQCTKLTSLTPGAERKAFASTVEAVRNVAARNEDGIVALASREAIEVMQLEVYDENIANNPGRNRTKFYWCKKNGKHSRLNPEALYHAVLVIPNDAPGVLHNITGMITRARINLTSTLTRNLDLEEYMFFFEMQRLGKPEQLEILARQMELDDEIRTVQWLGSWNQRIDN